MLKRLLVALSLALSVTSIAVASPLHATDSNYRGAFTLLAVANTSGAFAKYSTQIVMTNLSNHSTYVRLELYSNSGYREGTLVNPLPAANGTGAGSFWGGSQPNWEFDAALGTNGFGALRVVAVHSDGSEDTAAVLRGYARLWIEPISGGRMSELVPGLTDYEASGNYRKSSLHVTEGDWAPYIIDPKPFARDLQDTTYGGARINVGLVNFDREHEATFTVGPTKGNDLSGGTLSGGPIVVTVEPGSMKQVPLPLQYFVGSNPSPDFPYATPLTTQVFIVTRDGDGAWGTYATLTDGASGASTFFLDNFTDSH